MSNRLFDKGTADMLKSEADRKRFAELYPSGTGPIKASAISSEAAAKLKHDAEYPKYGRR